MFLDEVKKITILLLLILAGCSDFGINPKEDQVITGDVSYAKDIQPMFNSICVNCHPNQGQLSLRNYTNLMKGGKSGAVVIPKDGAGSLLVKKLEGTASGDRMPPKPAGEWSTTKIELVKKWIDQGAENN